MTSIAFPCHIYRRRSHQPHTFILSSVRFAAMSTLPIFLTTKKELHEHLINFYISISLNRGVVIVVGSRQCTLCIRTSFWMAEQFVNIRSQNYCVCINVDVLMFRMKSLAHNKIGSKIGQNKAQYQTCLTVKTPKFSFIPTMCVLMVK